MVRSTTSSPKRDKDEVTDVVGKGKAKEERNDMSEGLDTSGRQNDEKFREKKRVEDICSRKLLEKAGIGSAYRAHDDEVRVAMKQQKL